MFMRCKTDTSLILNISYYLGTLKIKLTTTLLASLIFASTGAIANTTKLTDQDELLIQRAERMQFRRCVAGQITKITEEPEWTEELETAYTIVLDDLYENDTQAQFTTSTAALMLVASCIAPARN